MIKNKHIKSRNKKAISLIVGILLITMPLVVAQETETDAGITPDQRFLWGIDIAIERIIMLITTRAENKVSFGLKIANERLAEIKAMASQNKTQFMKMAEFERGNIINEIEKNAAGLSEEHRLQISERLQNHIKQLEEVKETIPEQAREGLENAINKSSKVLERMRIRIG
jgi:F0F1-type ATP synthase membrane subunit b/b'